MCGIAGVVDRRVGAPLAVGRLTATLRHRGPDSVGAYERPGAAIGQTRLAVIDLHTGDPPLTNEDGTVGVAFNGEIYNFRRLRAQLARDGHELKSAGDTEVIAHLAEDLEPVALAGALDGMFAFAVWDERRGRLVLGRDRFGTKPLYYWTDGQRLVFGSEIKAVLADPAVPSRLCPGAISAYLTFGYVPTPRTFFEGVHSLPPAHVLTFDLGRRPPAPSGEQACTVSSGEHGGPARSSGHGGPGVRIERYWSQPVPGVDGVSALDCDFEEARRETRRLLCDAVDRRLVADVPLGAFLSGGVDSSLVVAFMARLGSRPVRTFTIGFDDADGFDERPFAAEVARRYGTEHTEFVVRPDKAELVERLVFHHDQPFGDSSALPTFVLAEMTRRHVTVALCGDGGDELFGGYERFPAALAVDRVDRLPAVARDLLRAGARRTSTSLLGRGGGGGLAAARLLHRLPDGLPDAYRSWVSFVPETWHGRLLGTRAEERSWAVEDYQGIWDASAGAAPLDRLLDLNVRTYLLDDLLPKVDRMSMAHGLEVRSPFLDTALAEFVGRLVPSTKVLGPSRKRVLKAVGRDLLPHHLLHRRKRGFGVPLDRWFRTDLEGYARSLLCSPQTRLAEHLHGPTVRQLMDEHRAGVAEHGHAIWTLVTLEVFLRQVGW